MVSVDARAGIGGWVKSHPVASFFTLAYGISWLAWLPIVLGFGGGIAPLLMMIAQFGPALAALAVALASGASLRGWASGIVRWRVAPAWYLLALGLPALLVAVESAAFALLGGPTDLAVLPDLISYAVTVVVLTLIAGLGEEPGWRGFALPRLQSRLAPLAATLLLGVVWAVWHLPLVFVDPRFPHGFAAPTSLVLLAVLTLVGIVLFAFFYTWVYNRTKSILLCAILHGSFNTATGLVPATLEMLQREVYVTLLVVQDVTLLVAVLIVLAVTGGRLGYEAASEGA